MKKMMNVQQRVRLSRLVEKMKQQKTYSEKLGLEDVSLFHGKRIGGDKKC